MTEPGDDSVPTSDVPLLELERVGKRFYGVDVLRDVDLRLDAGQIHAVVGENGAGKSTLMKIIAGVHRADQGVVRLRGEPVTFSHPVQAQAAGIGIVYQELNLLPDRTVAQNTFLGREPGRAWWVDGRRLERDTRAVLDRLGVGGSLRPGQLVGELPVAAQQMVEIAKALSQDARLLIFDEPTAALANAESEALFATLQSLAAEGIGILYVSHRLPEIFALSDRITVLKDGQVVRSDPTGALDRSTLIAAMVGRELDHYYPERSSSTGLDPVVRVQGGGNTVLHDIELDLRPGEICGVAGLAGSGRTELVKALFGDEPFTRGTVSVEGREVRVRSPRQAVAFGFGCISEDRKLEGLVLGHDVTSNGLLPLRSMPGRLRSARLAGERAGKRLAALLETVELRGGRSGAPVQYLSGGNQQKVVLAKWLATQAKVLLLDEPTRGIDVGAKSGIHDLVREVAELGLAVLMVSSELPEVIGMSDRILVMRDGTIAGELPAGSSEREIMELAAAGETVVGESGETLVDREAHDGGRQEAVAR